MTLPLIIIRNSNFSMPSVVIDVNNINLREVEDEDRPSFRFGSIPFDDRQLEIRFIGVTGCKELGLGSNIVDLDQVKLSMDQIAPRAFKKSIGKILRY